MGTVILVTSSPPVWLYALGALFVLGLLAAGFAWTKRIKSTPSRPTPLATNMDVVAHEIRTPLSLIKAAAELLDSAGPLTDEQRQFTKTIQTNAEHAIHVAEDILTLAKPDAKNGDLDLKTFDLRELTRETASELRSIHEFPILLNDSGMPLMINADPTLIKHALWNLINNAIRHAGNDGQIVVHTYVSSQHMGIEVKDLGTGIAPDERESLFVPFHQSSHEKHTPAGEGAGLGLAIVERIVTSHGGEVLVDSLWGRGTSIHILLPKDTAQAIGRRK